MFVVAFKVISPININLRQLKYPAFFYKQPQYWKNLQQGRVFFRIPLCMYSRGRLTTVTLSDGPMNQPQKIEQIHEILLHTVS